MKLDKRYVLYISILAYIILNIIMVMYHEPWRDEAQAILISSAPDSLGDLITLTKYEGHPSLWFIILFFTLKLTNSIIFIQILHILIMGAGMYIFLKYAEIDIKVKLPVVFGYFFMYEYSIIARNYSIGITLLFLACYFLNKKNLIGAAIVVAILFHANIYAFFLGASLWFTLIITFFKSSQKKVIIGTVILFFSFVLLLLDILPPEDHFFATEHEIDFRNIMKGFTILWKSFIPIPELDMHFWNTNIMKQIFPDKYLSNVVMIIGAIILFVYSLNYLGKSSSALIFFCTTFLIITFFAITKYHGYLRHQGHLFISYIVAIWLKSLFPDNQFKQINLPIAENLLSKRAIPVFFKNHFISIVLYANILGTSITYFFDFQHQFSNGKMVANYIKENYSSKCNVVGHVDFCASTISYFLNKDLFYPMSDTYSSYVMWDIKRDRNLSDESLLEVFDNQKEKNNETILITSFEIEDKNALEKYKVSLVKVFNPAIVENESFYLYE